MRQLGAVTGEEERVVDFIVKAFASLAKSNSVLMGLKISAKDRANMDDIIRQTRIRYQQLCSFTSQSIVDNPRAYNRFRTRQPSIFRVPQGQMSARGGGVGGVAMPSHSSPSLGYPPKNLLTFSLTGHLKGSYTGRMPWNDVLYQNLQERSERD
jgi:hypothetical protein